MFQTTNQMVISSTSLSLRMFFGPASDSRTTNETRSPTFRFMGTWQGLTTQNTFFGARPSSQDRISIAFDDFPFRRLPGLVNLRLRSELEFSVGKSTISTGPFSIVFCRFTRGLLGRIPQVAWVAWNRPGSTCSGGISASLPWTPEISWIEQGASKKPGWWCNNHFEKYESQWGWDYPIYEMEHNPVMFETTNKKHICNPSIDTVCGLCRRCSLKPPDKCLTRVLACVTVTYKKVSGR